MKVLITGANGQLGHEIAKRLTKLNIENKGVDLDDFDLTDGDATISYIKDYRPTHVVHCAAYTAVDKAEDERELCTAINVGGTRHVAFACKDIGAEMMYFSTDYVFDGFSKDTPWEVDDEKNPQNHYGMTKWQGEQQVTELLDNYYIVRISWVFGSNGHNFVRTMLRLSESKDFINVVDDQYGAPTYAADVALLVCEMLQSKKHGVYHAPNSGVCSWYDFAKEIFEMAGINVDVTGIPTSEYPTAASRPKNSKLSMTSLDQAGFYRLPDYRDALHRFLEEINVI